MRILICLALAVSLLVKADSLSLGSASGAVGEVLQLPFHFTNTNQIVGMQFDLTFLQEEIEVGSATAASETTDHIAESREVAVGKRRIVLYSGSNQVLPDDLILEIPLTLKSEAQPGEPTLNVVNVIFTNALGQSFVPTINRPQYVAWLLAHFTEVERNDPAISGDAVDLDGDGLSNLLEFLMGANPKVHQASHKLRPGHGLNQSNNKRYLTLTFRAGKNISDGTLVVEGSGDLVTWTSNGIVLFPTGDEDASSVEYEASMEVDGVTRQFLRLVGTRDTEP